MTVETGSRRVNGYGVEENQKRSLVGGGFWWIDRRKDRKVSGGEVEVGRRQQSTAFYIARENDSRGAVPRTVANVVRRGRNQPRPNIPDDDQGKRYVIASQHAVVQPLSVPRTRPRQHEDSMALRRRISDEFAYVEEDHTARRKVRVSSDSSHQWSDGSFYESRLRLGNRGPRGFSTLPGPQGYLEEFSVPAFVQLPGSFTPTQNRRVASFPGSAGMSSHGYHFQPSGSQNGGSGPRCDNSPQSRSQCSTD
ncbi:hypothetical protein V1517DRAFT_113649 [Lipomyces orientalis]|uniref:Uncharacterized protein n=1 Tax=Lipomyces orientalis TaxID=1233043 RepID=A0ACC3TQH7_9ASCO